MRSKILLLSLATFFSLTISVFAQQTVLVNDPNAKTTEPKISPAEENLIRREVLPKARKKWTSDVCDEEFEVKGAAKGAFTKSAANQTLIIYQFCETGNGLANNGLVLIENGKIISSYISEVGWVLDLKALPDINQNGLDEFAVFYSGGMHQGESGTGVDIMEFSGARLKGLGWFQAESESERSGDFAYKVTVTPGKVPVFYREKYVSTKSGKWRKAGGATKFSLRKTVGEFSLLK